MSAIARDADSAGRPTDVARHAHPQRRPRLDRAPMARRRRGVRAFVTTRNGGVSGGAHASLDLGGASTAGAAPEAAAAIAENRATRPGLPAIRARVARAGARRDVAVDRGIEPRPTRPRADAAVTRETNVVLAVRIADCMPVLLADRAGAVIGVAHAGWRGLAAGVIENTVAAMGCDAVERRRVARPGHRPRRVRGRRRRPRRIRARRRRGAPRVRRRGARKMARRSRSARARAARARRRPLGDGGGMCTSSEPARFFSYRRDGASGRMGAFIWLADARA